MKHQLVLSCTFVSCVVLAGCTSQDTDGTSRKPSVADSASSSPSVAAPVPLGTGASGTSGNQTATTLPGARSSASSTPESSASQRCHTGELTLSVGANHPGAGQSGFALVLTNGSRRTCTVHGYPGLAFVDGTGAAVTPDPERATGEPVQTVLLAPGASAWSAVEYTNPALTGVTTVKPTALLVTAPDETAPISVPWTGGEVPNTGKASVPRVSPLRPGDGA